MITILKLITLPIWLPIKVLWAFSKIIAFFIMIFLVAVLVYLAVHLL